MGRVQEEYVPVRSAANEKKEEYKKERGERILNQYREENKQSTLQ